MPLITIIKDYSNGTPLTEAQLDTRRTSTHTAFNTDKFDEDNFQDGCISTALLASSSVTADKIETDAITTTAFNDASVTRAKRSSVGQQTSGSSLETTFSVTLTTNGRPVEMELVSNSSSSQGVVSCRTRIGAINSTTGEWKVTFSRSGTTLGIVGYKTVYDAATDKTFTKPSGCLKYFDTNPIAGTYTYTILLEDVGTTSTASFIDCKFFAYEL